LAGVRLRANETEFSAAMWAHEAREGLYLLSSFTHIKLVRPGPLKVCQRTFGGCGYDIITGQMPFLHLTNSVKTLME